MILVVAAAEIEFTSGLDDSAVVFEYTARREKVAADIYCGIRIVGNRAIVPRARRGAVERVPP